MPPLYVHGKRTNFWVVEGPDGSFWKEARCTVCAPYGSKIKMECPKCSDLGELYERLFEHPFLGDLHCRSCGLTDDHPLHGLVQVQTV